MKPVNFAALLEAVEKLPSLTIEEEFAARVEYMLLEESTYEPGERRWYEPWEL